MEEWEKFCSDILIVLTRNRLSFFRLRSSLVARGWTECNLDPIPAFHSHLSHLHILQRGISVFYTALSLVVPAHIPPASGPVAAPGISAGPEKRHEFPHQSFIDPPLVLELVDIIPPDISVVMKTPQVESYHNTLFYEDRRATAGTTAYWKNCIPKCGTKHASRGAL